MEFVIKGIVKGFSEKGTNKGWVFRELFVVNHKDTFRIVFWGDNADLPTAYNPGDEIEVACEFRSEEKINNQTNAVYVAMRINGWAIKPVFKGVYVDDYLRAKHSNEYQEKPNPIDKLPM